MLWVIMMISIAVFLILNTYSIIYYRSVFNDPENKNINALKVTGMMVGIYLVLGVGMHFIDGHMYIPFQLQTVDLVNLDFSEEGVAFTVTVPESSGKLFYSTPSGFMAAFMSPLIIMSSIFFALYVGAGMAFLPFDLILAYNHKPVKPDPMKHIYTKKVLMSRAEELIQQSKELYDLKQNILLTPPENIEEIKTKSRLLRAGIHDIKEDVLTYNDMLDIYKKEDNIVEVNPLTYILYLILGIIGFIISAMYLLHNLLGIKGIDIIISELLDAIKAKSTLISLVVFLILCTYTLITAIYGFYKFSFLSSYLSHGYPVIIDGTWTDTFLVNINMLLLVTVGNVMFYTQSARIYFVNTDADVYVGTLLGNFKIHNTMQNFGLFNILFILVFLLCLFSYFFIRSPHSMLNKIVKGRLEEANREKEELLKSTIKE